MHHRQTVVIKKRAATGNGTGKETAKTIAPEFRKKTRRRGDGMKGRWREKKKGRKFGIKG